MHCTENKHWKKRYTCIHISNVCVAQGLDRGYTGIAGFRDSTPNDGEQDGKENGKLIAKYCKLRLCYAGACNGV